MHNEGKHCLAGRLLVVSLACAGPAIMADDTPQPPDPGLRAALVKAVNDSESFNNRFDAEVWLLDMSTRLTPLLADANKRLSLLRAVHREARRVHLTPELVLAVIQVESRFSQYAISWAGARGLMQVMPFWKKDIGRPDDDLFSLDTNLRYGCTILRYYLNQTHGDLTGALARYNGSAGQYAYAARVETALANRWYRW